MYLGISILCLVVSFFLFKRVAGTLSLSQPNMITWVFYFQLVLQSFIASILVVYNLDDHYMINKIHNQHVLVTGWASVQYTMIMMPLGMTIMMWLFGKKHNKSTFNEYCKSPISFSLGSDKLLKNLFRLLSIISVLSVLYTYSYLKDNPMFALFTMDKETLARLSIMNSREFTGNMYVKNILALLLTPILSYIAFVYYKKTKLKIDKYWFFIMSIASVLIVFYNFSKAPIVQYALGFLFIAVLLGKVISKKQLVKYFLYVLGGIFSLYLMLMVTDDVDINHLLFNYNSGIWGRILLSQAGGTYFSFELFPSEIPFIGFDSFSKLFGGTSERSARLIMEYYNPEEVRLGIVGVMNSLFIGEAWANFGFIGVLLAPLIVGMEVQFIYQKLITGKKTPLKVGLYAYLIFGIPITGGFNDFIYNPTWIMLIIIFGGVYQFTLMTRKYL